jgi:hypothetical protein
MALNFLACDRDQAFCFHRHPLLAADRTALPRRHRLPRAQCQQRPGSCDHRPLWVRHEQALAGPLVQSLTRCAAAGLVRLRLTCLDGTKVAANAAQQAKAQLEAEAAARQQRYQQRVAELAAAARARGQQPRAHIRPRRDEAPNPKATVNPTDPDSRVSAATAEPCRATTLRRPSPLSRWWSRLS